MRLVLRHFATLVHILAHVALVQVLEFLWEWFDLCERVCTQGKETVPGRPPLLLLSH